MFLAKAMKMIRNGIQIMFLNKVWMYFASLELAKILSIMVFSFIYYHYNM